MKRVLCLLLTFSMIFGGAAAEVSHNYNDPSVITVGLYPHVNDYDLFCHLVEEMWQVEDVRLEFIYWDGYSEPPEGIDVLMYDALYTTYLAENGWLTPLSPGDVDDYDDIIPYSWQGAYHNDTLYGIPGFLCAFFLMHDKNDEVLSAADNIMEVYHVLGPNTKDSKKSPNNREGLMIDIASYAANLYLESWIDSIGRTSHPQDFPQTDDGHAISSLHTLIRMQNNHHAYPFEWDASLLDTPIEWFNDGVGRAYIGFSEHMDWMDDRADELDIRLISFSANQNVPAFYTDVLSINANITDKRKIQRCKELINLIASKPLMTRLMTGDADEPTYLLPARTSTWNALSARYPLYARLYESVSKEDACILRFGPFFYSWVIESLDELTQVFSRMDR